MSMVRKASFALMLTVVLSGAAARADGIVLIAADPYRPEKEIAALAAALPALVEATAPLGKRQVVLHATGLRHPTLKLRGTGPEELRQRANDFRALASTRRRDVDLAADLARIGGVLGEARDPGARRLVVLLHDLELVTEKLDLTGLSLGDAFLFRGPLAERWLAAASDGWRGTDVVVLTSPQRPIGLRRAGERFWSAAFARVGATLRYYGSSHSIGQTSQMPVLTPLIAQVASGERPPLVASPAIAPATMLQVFDASGGARSLSVTP